MNSTEVEDRFTAALNDFRTAVQSLIEALEFSVKAPIPTVATILLNSGIVTLVSALEESIRNLVVEYLRVIGEISDDFRSLRTDLQKASVLAYVDEIKENRDDYNLIARAIDGLRKCVVGDADFIFLERRISYNRGNFKSTEVTDVVSRLGIRETWRLVCIDESLEEITGIVNLEARRNEVISKWNELFDERDVIVHRLSQASGWGLERIKASAGLTSAVVTRLARVLADDAISHLPRQHIGTLKLRASWRL